MIIDSSVYATTLVPSFLVCMHSIRSDEFPKKLISEVISQFVPY